MLLPSRFRSVTIVLTLFIPLAVLPGCGDKKEKPALPMIENQADPEELPVLEQNFLSKTNQETSAPEPDYSFTDFSNDLLAVPEDAVSAPNHD